MRHVIIGNGPAGVIAAETLRAQRPQDNIVLVGDEPEPPYSRMAIPYLLSGNIGEPGTYLRKGPDHFAGLRIALRRAAAQRIDTQARTVVLNDGGVLAYDRLLLATGAAPSSPPIPGIDQPGVLTCWTLADARKIADSVQQGARVLQLGAGFIGCIIMEAIAARGATLTVVEMGDRVVPRMMPPGASALIKRWCEGKGVRILTGAKATRIERDTGGLHVTLEQGETLDVDVVISATGVRPQIGFLAGSAIATETGILVDDRMQTSVANVYAAGDCVEAVEFGTGKRFINAIQLNAADQARIAAMNMAGRPTRSQGALAINVLDTFGLISASFGQWQGVAGGDHTELSDDGAFKYLRLEFDGDVLAGATSLGLTEHVGVIRGLIQSRTKLGPWKARLMRDPTQLMAAYLACAQAAA
ncbi:MAG: FAD-dependent oxidoreductase [Acetobacteraceae bacterium]|jgi:NADPH-dependent 2,4-dienoyl-CoA reductase/sulfur reductase-like enzyme